MACSLLAHAFHMLLDLLELSCELKAIVSVFADFMWFLQ